MQNKKIKRRVVAEAKILRQRLGHDEAKASIFETKTFKVNKNSSSRKRSMELKGLRMNIGKTKVMRCQVRIGQAEESGKYPCGMCRQGVGDNSIKCV